MKHGTDVNKRENIMSKVILECKELDVQQYIDAIPNLDLRGMATLFRAIKDKRAVVSKYDRDLKAIEDFVSEAMGNKLSEEQLTRATFDGIGTVQSSTNIRVSIGDSEKFYSFVLSEINKYQEELGTPTAGFGYLGKSVTQAAMRDLLETRAKESLEDNPYGPATLEAGLSYEEQLMLRMQEEADLVGVKLYEDTKTTVVKR